MPGATTRARGRDSIDANCFPCTLQAWRVSKFFFAIFTQYTRLSRFWMSFSGAVGFVATVTATRHNRAVPAALGRRIGRGGGPSQCRVVVGFAPNVRESGHSRSEWGRGGVRTSDPQEERCRLGVFGVHTGLWMARPR